MDSQDPQQPSAAELRAFAYRLLGRREYSVYELGHRLQRKWPGLDEGAVEELLRALIEENLLSDERFAESYVRSQVRRHQGPRKIRANLQARGVLDSIITGELERYAGEWTELAGAWLERQHPGELDYGARGKYYRRLSNRGFTHDQAMDAVNHHPRSSSRA